MSIESDYIEIEIPPHQVDEICNNAALPAFVSVSQYGVLKPKRGEVGCCEDVRIFVQHGVNPLLKTAPTWTESLRDFVRIRRVVFEAIRYQRQMLENEMSENALAKAALMYGDVSVRDKVLGLREEIVSRRKQIIEVLKEGSPDVH